MADVAANPCWFLEGMDLELTGREILGQAKAELVYQGQEGMEGSQKAELN